MLNPIWDCLPTSMQQQLRSRYPAVGRDIRRSPPKPIYPTEIEDYKRLMEEKPNWDKRSDIEAGYG